MTPWAFSIKFLYDTQFTFGSLMFSIGKEKNLELLAQGASPKHLTLVYGQAPYLPTNSSTSGGVCLGLNLYAGPYHRDTKTKHGLPIRAHIFQPSAGISSSSTSGASPYHDSTDDYPKTL
jgi:hypothetical protein